MSHPTDCLTAKTNPKTADSGAGRFGWIRALAHRAPTLARWAIPLVSVTGLALVALQLYVIHRSPELAAVADGRLLDNYADRMPEVLAVWLSPAYQIMLVLAGTCLALGVALFLGHGRGRYPSKSTRRLVAGCGLMGAALLLTSQLLVKGTYELGLGLAGWTFELPLRIALLCLAVGAGALALRPRARIPMLLAIVGVLSAVILLLIPRTAGEVNYDAHRIIQQREHYTPAVALRYDDRAIPGVRMVRSLAPREAARQDLIRRSQNPRALLSLPVLRPYSDRVNRYLAWQRYRIFGILMAVLLAVPLLGLALWSRRTQHWRLFLALASIAATVGSLGLFSAVSTLPAWHHFVVGLTLVPAVLLLIARLAVGVRAPSPVHPLCTERRENETYLIATVRKR